MGPRACTRWLAGAAFTFVFVATQSASALSTSPPQCGGCTVASFQCGSIGPRPVDFALLSQPIPIIDGPITMVQSAGGGFAQFFALPLKEFCLDDECFGSSRLAISSADAPQSLLASEPGSDTPGARCAVVCEPIPGCITGPGDVCGGTRMTSFIRAVVGPDPSPIDEGPQVGSAPPGALFPQCQLAGPGNFEARCENPDVYRTLESAIQLFGGDKWPAFCNGQPTDRQEPCLDGRLCRVANDPDRCLQCNGDRCYRMSAAGFFDDVFNFFKWAFGTDDGCGADCGKEVVCEEAGSTVEGCNASTDKPAPTPGEQEKEKTAETYNPSNPNWFNRFISLVTTLLTDTGDPAHVDKRARPDRAELWPVATTNDCMTLGPAFPGCATMNQPVGSLRVLPFGMRTLKPIFPQRVPTRGDPVTVGSGDLIDSAVDLEIPAQDGTAGLHFKLERYYSSGGITQGSLGRNWMHSYEERLEPVTENTPGVMQMPSWCRSAPGTVHCVYHHYGPDQVQIFALDPDRLVFMPPPGGTSVLAISWELGTGEPTWIMREADGSLTVFDNRGRLHSKRDRQGNGLHFYYGPKGTDRLLKVIDPLQRVIEFTYEGNRLESVKDFSGRKVSYRYEILEPRNQLEPDLAKNLGITGSVIPGMFGEQWRLIAVDQNVPATTASAARTLSWQYRYLTLDEARAELPPPPEPWRSSPDPCSDGPADALTARLQRELMIDHLLGNMVAVTDPMGIQTLDVTYERNPSSTSFDRVIHQQYGVRVGSVRGADVAYFDRACAGGTCVVPPELTTGLAPQQRGSSTSIGYDSDSCADIMDRHLGRPYLADEEPRRQPWKVFSPARWILDVDTNAVMGVQPEPIAPVDVGSYSRTLGADLATVCQWTRTHDQIGIERWSGVNFVGQELVAAVQTSPGESLSWLRTITHYNFLGSTDYVIEPDGRRLDMTYDVVNPSPFSRKNLLSVKETKTPGQAPAGVAERVWSFEYEPLYNQVTKVTDALGRITQVIYDYQEASGATQAPAILSHLRLFGVAAANLSDLAPNLAFANADQNFDGRIDQDMGNPVAIHAPSTIVAHKPQPFVTLLRHNDFGQLTRITEPEGRETFLEYYAATIPDGIERVPMTATYLPSLNGLQQALRGFTGGYLFSVKKVLKQPSSATAFARDDNQTVARFFSYDRFGGISREQDGRGSTQLFERDGFGLVHRAVDAEGFATESDYDEKLRRVETREQIAGANIRRTRFFWDVADQLVGECVELSPGACNGNLVALGQARASSASMLLTTYERDGEGRLTATVDREGHRHTSELNTRGLPLRVTVAAGSLVPETTSFSYDEGGRLRVQLNGAGDRTETIYDGFGRLMRTVLPDGTSVALESDLADRVVSKIVRDLIGTELALTGVDYDERDRARRVTRRWTLPAGAPLQTNYTSILETLIEPDAHGSPRRIVDPAGGITQFEYSSFGDAIRTIDALGNETLSYVDVQARESLTREIGEGRNVEQAVAFDRRGLATRSQQRGGALQTTTTQTYDGLGNVLDAIDAQGNRRHFEYDLVGRLRLSFVPEIERAAPNLATRYDYDRRGLTTLVSDPAGVATRTAWSAAGRLVSEQAGTITTRLRHDGAGRVNEITRADGTRLSVQYNFGHLRRISAFEPNGAVSTVRTLDTDGLGRVRSATQTSGTRTVVTNLAWDSLSRLIEERTRIDAGPDLRVGYGYDRLGAERTLVYPDASITQSDVDPLGRPTAIRVPQRSHDVSLVWRGAQLASYSVATAQPRIQSGTAFDGLERPIEQSVFASTLIFHEERSLDPLGRMRLAHEQWRVRDQLKSGLRVRAAEYSGAGWLTALTETKGLAPLGDLQNNEEVRAYNEANGRTADTSFFGRNAVGTLLDERRAGERVALFQATSLAPVNHEYDTVRVDGKNVGIKYDAVGRVTKDGRNEYAWNSFDHLTLATTKQGKFEYVYDAFDRRVARIKRFKSGASSERFVWAGQRIVETYADTLPSRRIVNGPRLDQPLVVESEISSASPQVDYPIFDLHGSVRGFRRGAAGDPFERYEYDAYGNVRVLDATGALVCDEATSANPCAMLSRHGYAGSERDGESGNYYLRNRYYSPALRSFLSQDPLGYVDSFNPWAYVGNDPLNFIDPLGLMSQSCPGGRCYAGVLVDLTGADAAMRSFRRLTACNDPVCGAIEDGGRLVRAGYNATLAEGVDRLMLRPLATFESNFRKFAQPIVGGIARGLEVVGDVYSTIETGVCGYPGCSMQAPGAQQMSSGVQALRWLARWMGGLAGRARALQVGSKAIFQIPQSIGAARHPVYTRLEGAISRHGGELVEGGVRFPTRRAARQAASEIAGNMGPGARPIAASEFRGGPWTWKDSNRVIGRQSSDGAVMWRDDVLGHPQFGLGPHVNVEVEGIGLHLFY